MSRTRLVLVAVGAAIIVLVGVANLLLGLTVFKAHEARQIERFVERYQRDDADEGYRTLFGEARSFREQIAAAAVDNFGFTGGAAMSIGLLLLCWLVDRHRLMKRIAALGSPARTDGQV